MKSLGPYRIGEKLVVRRRSDRIVLDIEDRAERVLPIDTFHGWNVEATYQSHQIGWFLCAVLFLGLGAALLGFVVPVFGSALGTGLLVAGFAVAYVQHLRTPTFLISLVGEGVSPQRLIVSEDELQEIALGLRLAGDPPPLMG